MRIRTNKTGKKGHAVQKTGERPTHLFVRLSKGCLLQSLSNILPALRKEPSVAYATLCVSFRLVQQHDLTSRRLDDHHAGAKHEVLSEEEAVRYRMRRHRGEFCRPIPVRSMRLGSYASIGATGCERAVGTRGSLRIRCLVVSGGGLLRIVLCLRTSVTLRAL